jgi:putative flippase GtrA
MAAWQRWAGDGLTWLVDRLPVRLRRVLPRELVGFALLGGLTFLIDLALLAALRHWTRLPLALAVSIAYVAAFGLNFALNRTVNFRSHAPVGAQAVRYALVVVGDYLLTLGVTTGLSAAGLDFRLARVTAATCVAVFTYSASRWWVFQDQPGASGGSAPDVDQQGRGEAGTEQSGDDGHRHRGRDARDKQQQAAQQGGHHRGGDLPVVADDEVVQETADSPDEVHTIASLGSSAACAG